MNLLNMLEAAKPWAAPQVAPQAPPKERRPRRGTNNYNGALHAEALAKYRAVCQGEWTRTTTIEDRLGKGRSCAAGTLKKWEKAGLVRRRPVKDANGPGRVRYEWKFEGEWK